MLTDYIDAVEIVAPIATPPVVAADRDNDAVIAAAVAAEAELIVPGDRDLLDLGQYERSDPSGRPTPSSASAEWLLSVARGFALGESCRERTGRRQWR